MICKERLLIVSTGQVQVYLLSERTNESMTLMTAGLSTND